jgi:hypothetical protein
MCSALRALLAFKAAKEIVALAAVQFLTKPPFPSNM